MNFPLRVPALQKRAQKHEGAPRFKLSAFETCLRSYWTTSWNEVEDVAPEVPLTVML